ncbi:hypothetical protein AGMMS49960_14610 [Betaproteobacteria bacterium]|nr:hypothetical protein AGMMS49543_20130 [Betaproteobacteria bacterium]GHU02405.1 hypothetical protein AGMMS49960_14610 [Betaproteobacteria bacterium]GHU22113.1 hypothetical protein AGMMS50243_21060 [Betaproteobacteria bacterium]
MISAVSSASSAIYASSLYANAVRTPDASQQSGSGRNTLGQEQVSQEDQRRIDELKTTDRKVRTHEAAHMAAGGSLVTSGASFEYETGPDGQRYAVAGEVGIDTSKGRTPEETLARAQQIRAAALAPADPSGQDRAVAAAAAQMAAAAQAEIAQANVAPDEEAGEAEPVTPPGARPQSDDANALDQVIARSLSPSSAGRAVNIYA